MRNVRLYEGKPTRLHTHWKIQMRKCTAFISLIPTFSHNSHDSGCWDKVFLGCRTNCGRVWWWWHTCVPQGRSSLGLLDIPKECGRKVRMKLLGQRSNGLLKICNLIIRVHPQRHNKCKRGKTRLKNVKIIIAKRFGRHYLT